jgi:hypothetical protein
MQIQITNGTKTRWINQANLDAYKRAGFDVVKAEKSENKQPEPKVLKPMAKVSEQIEEE